MTEHPNLASALVAALADLSVVNAGRTAKIPGKDGKQGYSYDYAGLPDVTKIAYPLLTKHGLSFTCSPKHIEGVGFVLVGVLRHTSGGEDTGMLPITGRDAQAIGSSLTYNRRYLLGCMTGLVTDDDEDGGLAAQQGTDRPQAYQPPPIPSRAVIDAKIEEALTTLGLTEADARLWHESETGVSSQIDLTDGPAYEFAKALVQRIPGDR
jgi:hypothetical protein